MSVHKIARIRPGFPDRTTKSCMYFYNEKNSKPKKKNKIVYSSTLRRVCKQIHSISVHRPNLDSHINPFVYLLWVDLNYRIFRLIVILSIFFAGTLFSSNFCCSWMRQCVCLCVFMVERVYLHSQKTMNKCTIKRQRQEIV